MADSKSKIACTVRYSITRQLAQYEPELIEMTLSQGIDGEYSPEDLLLECQRLVRSNTLRAQQLRNNKNEKAE